MQPPWDQWCRVTLEVASGVGLGHLRPPGPCAPPPSVPPLDLLRAIRGGNPGRPHHRDRPDADRDEDSGLPQRSGLSPSAPQGREHLGWGPPGPGSEAPPRRRIQAWGDLGPGSQARSLSSEPPPKSRFPPDHCALPPFTSPAASPPGPGSQAQSWRRTRAWGRRGPGSGARPLSPPGPPPSPGSHARLRCRASPCLPSGPLSTARLPR